jgi:UDP-glucose 4-epimerase
LNGKNLFVVGSTSYLAGHFSEATKDHFSVVGAPRFENIDRHPQHDDVFLNFSTAPDYLNKPYDPRCDVDLQIAQRLKNTPAHFVMMSTRMVYGPGEGRTLRETASPDPRSNYAQNKLESENRVLEILGDKCTVLRLSNIFGMEYGRRTFAGDALTSLKNNGKIYLDIRKDVFRDFLPVQTFTKMLCNFVASPASGTYNLGSGHKTSVGEIANWFVEGYGFGEVEVTEDRNFDSFCLDVSKIGNIIDVNVTKNEIEQFAKQAGRELKDA